MYKVGDVIVHPLHGAGIISAIETKKMSGVVRAYYLMKIPVGDMSVLIPTDNCCEIGVRELISEDEADRLLSEIPQISEEESQNWNKRYRDNMFKIKSGDPTKVAEVIMSLMHRDTERALSTGERKMLRNAKQILISEIVLVKNDTFENIEAKLNKLYCGR